MDPLEILRNQMDEEYFAKVERLIAEGATWDWATFTNEAALEVKENQYGLRQYAVIVDFDAEDFEVTDIWDSL